MAAAARSRAGTPSAPPADSFRRAAAATASATRPAATHSAPGGRRTPGRSCGAASGAGGRRACNRQERDPPSPDLLAFSQTERRRKRSVKGTSRVRSPRPVTGWTTGLSPLGFAGALGPLCQRVRATCKRFHPHGGGVHLRHLTASLHSSQTLRGTEEFGKSEVFNNRQKSAAIKQPKHDV